MPVLSTQARTAHANISLWQQRRDTVGTVWHDAQRQKFERVCSEEILALLLKHASHVEDLDAALTASLRLLDS